MDWNFDNPALALKEYCGQSVLFGEKKRKSELLAGELPQKKVELEQNIKERDSAQTRLQTMGEFTGEDIDAQIKAAIQQAETQIAGIQQTFEKKKIELSAQMEADLKENDSQLNQELQRLSKDGLDATRELTEAEQKALAWEIERREYANASNQVINTCQDGIVQENLDCQSMAGQWKKEQDEVTAQFGPNIATYQSQLDQIRQRYQPDVQTCQNAVSAAVFDRDEELSQLQAERSREIQLANQEISGYQRDFKQAEKQFNEQIRMAKVQGKPTARMENSRSTRLNGLNDKIQKVNNRIDKKVLSIDQKISAAQAKHSKRIQKAETQLNQTVQRRDEEMKAPQEALRKLIQERDRQLSVLQEKIDRREAARKKKTEELHRSIDREVSAQEKHGREIDAQIAEFVMGGSTCFSQVLDESYGPFAALSGRTARWMELLRAIRKEKTDACYEAEHSRQKQALANMDYILLIQELEQAQRFSGKLSFFAQNNHVLTIISAILCAAGAVLAVALYTVLHQQTAAILGLLLVAAGGALGVLTIRNTGREFSAICKYITIASDYQDFPGISAHSTQVTQEREVAAMKAMGTKLYDVHYGKEAAKTRHKAKDADIRSDFDRDLRLLTVEHENARTELERTRDTQIDRVRSDNAQAETKFTQEKESLQIKVSQLDQKIQALKQRLQAMEDEQAENQAFFSSFEKNFAVLQDKLRQSSWMAPMSATRGRLDGQLYIIPETVSPDEYGHKPIYHVVHNKKPLVITYDISGIGEDGTSQNEKVGALIRDLLFDLMYSVYRLNSKESYDQLVVDAVGGSSDLKSTTVKNAFNITEVAGSLDEVRGRLRSFEAQRESLAEKGAKIDEVNEKKFQDQERPDVYHILYLVMKPNERRGRLDETVRKLLPDCDRYGFFPIFICEQESWASQSREKDNIYSDIKSFVNNPVVSFDGEHYLC